MTPEFSDVLLAHRGRYPLMEPQDYGKLAYQSAFGPEHMVPSRAEAARLLLEEWAEVPGDMPPKPPEPIGGGLCRFHLEGAAEFALPLLAELFCRTAAEHGGTAADLEERLVLLETLHVPGMEPFLADYRRRGCPSLRHSPAFRAAYRPHYRVLAAEYACYFPALLAVERLLAAGSSALVAIDGRCGSGKTGLAALVKRVFGGNVFHMDDFYLPPDQRTPDWEFTPGGNMDFARFLEEVLLPARAGETVRCRPYDCRSGRLMPPIPMPPAPLTVVEGSYSHHPLLAARYDLKIFLTSGPEEQARRLRKREGAYFQVFADRWIPMEERYFRRCGTEGGSGLVLDTTAFFR